MLIRHDLTLRPFDTDDYDYPGLETRLLVTVEVTLGEPEHIPCRSRPDLYNPGSGDELRVLAVQVLATPWGALGPVPSGHPLWTAAEQSVERNEALLVEKARDQGDDDPDARRDAVLDAARDLRRAA